MLNKKRLLQQLSLPCNLVGPFDVEWIRSTDLFGDHFALRARVDLELIRFDYFHHSAQEHPNSKQALWSFAIGLSPTGRAKIAQSEGVNPGLRTVQRAAALVDTATRQLQANPLAFLDKTATHADLHFTREPRSPSS